MVIKVFALVLLLSIVSSNFVECNSNRDIFHGLGRDHRFQKHVEENTIVVAQDGSGNYRTITEALEAVRGKISMTIYITKGVYNEYIKIRSDTKDLWLYGDGIGATIITGNHADTQYATNAFDTATVAIEGNDFVAQGITFRNTAAIQASPAPAVRIKADRVAFYQCSFEGYQDTLYTHSGRQFFKNCDIYGNVDFICGWAAAVFQDCNINLRRPITPNGEIIIAASSRGNNNSDAGLVFQNCRITPSEDISKTIIYLGRPWKPYARTVFMGTSIYVHLQPSGWRHWLNGSTDIDREAEKQVIYREFNNTGMGANTEGRVKWPGFKVITDEQDAKNFTVEIFIQGNDWIPQTGIPFTAGL